mgnify:CR=1 FL=1
MWTDVLAGIVILLFVNAFLLVHWVRKKRALTKGRGSFTYQELAGSYNYWDEYVTDFLPEDEQLTWSQFYDTSEAEKIRILTE